MHLFMQTFLIYALFSNNRASYIKNFVFGNKIPSLINTTAVVPLVIVLHFFAGIQSLCLNCIFIHLVFFRFLTTS